MRDWWILLPLLLTQAALPLGLLMFLPGLAFLPVALLMLLAWRNWAAMSRWERGIATGGTLLWALYAAYETRMYYWMQTVIAPIRVDLLLLIPLLWLASFAVMAASLRRRPF